MSVRVNVTLLKAALYVGLYACGALERSYVKKIHEMYECCANQLLTEQRQSLIFIATLTETETHRSIL